VENSGENMKQIGKTKTMYMNDEVQVEEVS
jgi:hypothetical protein